MTIVLVGCLVGCAEAVAGLPAPADFSHVLYLNACEPDGCMMLPGADDARASRSSLVTRSSYLPAFGWGSGTWGSLVECVRSAYAPFDLEVTDVDPGSQPHLEIVVAGTSANLGFAPNVGGVAPGECPGDVVDNSVGFAFSANSSDAASLCWTVAQESGHLLGLDHELDPLDPMAWIGPSIKPGFQDHDAACGEYAARSCVCDRPSQNSFALLRATLGPSAYY